VDLNHFWAARRFDVMRKLAQPVLSSRDKFCEIGCGNGLLQRQLELGANLEVDGIELCLPALEHNIAQRGALYYYNILERHPELWEKYGTLFLFDVLEHIDDDLGFLSACLFHLKRGGHVIISVPARNELFSRYDEAAGHVRRYTLPRLINLINDAGLEMETCSYWGLPLYPLLFVRKWMINRVPKELAYEKGFTPPNRIMNSVFRWLARFELIPQQRLGISLMAVARKP
jgi:SAM-dependent methyltransferase